MAANRIRAVSFGDDVVTKGKKKKSNESTGGGRIDQNDGTVPLRREGALDRDFQQLVQRNTGKGLRSLKLDGNQITNVALATAVEGRNTSKYLQLFVSSEKFDVGLKISTMMELSIVNNRLESFLSKDVLECMPKLRKLNLHDNKITQLPTDSLDTLAKFNQLQELNLGTNQITELPAEIGRLASLKVLKLSCNNLRSLPPQIVDLKGLYDEPDAFIIYGNNNLVVPPKLIAQLGGMECIRAYFQLLSPGGNVPSSERYRYNLVLHQLHHAVDTSGEKKKGSVPPPPPPKVTKNLPHRCLQLKLVVLGHQSSGKSTIVRKLCPASKGHAHKGSEPAAITPGTFRTFSNDHSTPTHASAAGKGALHGTFALQSPLSFSSPAGSANPGFGSPESLPRTPSSCNSHTPGGASDKDPANAVGVSIVHWHPKKAVLEPHILPAKATDSKKTGTKSLFSVQPDDVKFLVWEMTGRWMPHSVQEMFFSEYALHLVVFDLSVTATVQDCDAYVQHWIDLIQERAPGSTIVVVGTHADLLTAEQERDRVEMVKARIKSNEEHRVASIRKDIASCRSAEKRDAMQRMLDRRPVIDAEILAMGLGEEERGRQETLMLSCRLVQLATPTSSKPHPLSTINVPFPAFYSTVKDCIAVLKQERKAFCTIQELEQLVLGKRAGSSGSLHDLAGERAGRSMLYETKIAVAHWANVGEVSQAP
jgi:GTPase SAR1 family protein